jgi:allophanate hydrolase
MTSDNLSDLSFDLASLHAAYRGGLSPAAVMSEAYRRLDAAQDPAIFISLRPLADVEAEAGALPPMDLGAMPLWGIPFAVKDNIDVAGLSTTAACPAFAYSPSEDAFAIARLRAAGAIPIGKTNLDQFATGLVGVRSPYGVPRNSIDPDIVPGGSSSGSAVAVARGIVTFSLGTDTAGSGRVPAALNNIVGLKPTLGSVSASGVVPACRTLDTISIFALTVSDAWSAYRVTCAFDPLDSYARHYAAPALGAPPRALVVAVPDPASREFFGDDVQAESFNTAIGTIAGLGARIVEVDLSPFFAVARMLYDGAWVAERMTVIEDLLRRDPDAVLPVTRGIIGAADRLTAADAFRGIYRLADLRRAAEKQLAGVDLLCVPTIPGFCHLADLEADPVVPNSQLGTYTNFVNLMDMCGIAVPTGPRTDGRPGSVTFLARAGKDALAASLASALHSACNPVMGATEHPLPSVVPMTTALSDEMEIALVGAHMSGLGLNGQVTALGGRFLREGRTSADYRLFALPGGPPQRPGLLRFGAGGASIALELWAMPLASVGAFLAQIPAPLGLGQVRLEDGRHVTGFLVEAAGTEGGTDITALGGWRAYLASLA